MIQIHQLNLYSEHFQVSKNGHEIKLTSKELHILKLLMMNPKRAFSKEQIYRAVWNDDYLGDENAINIHIRRLRDKIEDVPASPQYNKTVWGNGYKLGSFKHDPAIIWSDPFYNYSEPYPISKSANKKQLTQNCNDLNLVLEQKRELTGSYTRTESSIKKMLANMSHDLKTP